MSKVIDYYFSITSPWTYMGGERLIEMAERHGAIINYKPVDLGNTIFPISGGLPLPKRAPQRQAYRLAELERWRDFLGIELNIKPKFFPAKGWPASGMVTAAREQGLDGGKLTNACLRAVWIEERDIDDTDTLVTIAGECGMDGAALLAAAYSEAVVSVFDADTQEAIERQVFGAPTYIYKDELFWGQDRLDFLDRALAK